jgi:predicted metal-dependent HD superfamily phosphohydrolase
MNHLALLLRWTERWKHIGGTTDPRPIYEQLVASYSEPHRAYHNLTHLHECLAALDASGVEPTSARIVEVALWFHDAVYDPKAGDNEEQSANLAVRTLREALVPARTIDEVRRLVLATKSHEVDGSPIQSLMLDVDLSILGSDAGRFSDYERQIRQEYSWVPTEMFAAKRIEILEKFLKRPRLFQLPWFYNRLESQARCNLMDSIAQLTCR